MFDFVKNKLLYRNKYQTHSEGVIVSCFFNPQKSPYRNKAFNIYYDSIKHLNHVIVECIIGDDKSQLLNIVKPDNLRIIYADNLLWHKECLINKAVSELPSKYKYIFWVDADVIFSNKNWMPEAVDKMKSGCNIVQLFEDCYHLNKDEFDPSPLQLSYKRIEKNKTYWRGFAYNCVHNEVFANSEDYDTHGHVGFAWGAKAECLDKVPLYDKALIGGADHIIAHASVGQIPHKCITKSFTEDIDDVMDWSKRFFDVINGRIGYVSGSLYHIWHGDIQKRQYLKRVIDFTPKAKRITEKDDNGLYITNDQATLAYMHDYFADREVPHESHSFGGGESGGGGSSGKWEQEQSTHTSHSHDHTHDVNSAIVASEISSNESNGSNDISNENFS